MLVRAGFAALGDFSEAVQVELALEAGKLVLLKKTTKNLRAQAGVITDLRRRIKRKPEGLALKKPNQTGFNEKRLVFLYLILIYILISVQEQSDFQRILYPQRTAKTEMERDLLLLSASFGVRCTLVGALYLQ